MTRLFMKSLQCELDLQKLSRSQSDANQKEEGKYRFVKCVSNTFHCLHCNRIRMQILYLYSLPPCWFLIYVIYSTGSFSHYFLISLVRAYKFLHKLWRSVCPNIDDEIYVFVSIVLHSIASSSRRYMSSVLNRLKFHTTYDLTHRFSDLNELENSHDMYL